MELRSVEAIIGTVEDPVFEREKLHTRQVSIECLRPINEAIADRPGYREVDHTPRVVIDSLRPVRDKIDDVVVKEIERVWVDEVRLM